MEKTTQVETHPWTVAANSLSYDEVSLLDLNVGDIEKLIRQACLAYADDQIGALHAAARARDKALEERDAARREIVIELRVLEGLLKNHYVGQSQILVENLLRRLDDSE